MKLHQAKPGKLEGDGNKEIRKDIAESGVLIMCCFLDLKTLKGKKKELLLREIKIVLDKLERSTLLIKKATVQEIIRQKLLIKWHADWEDEMKELAPFIADILELIDNRLLLLENKVIEFSREEVVSEVEYALSSQEKIDKDIGLFLLSVNDFMGKYMDHVLSGDMDSVNLKKGKEVPPEFISDAMELFVLFVAYDARRDFWLDSNNLDPNDYNFFLMFEDFLEKCLIKSGNLVTKNNLKAKLRRLCEDKVKN